MPKTDLDIHWFFRKLIQNGPVLFWGLWIGAEKGRFVRKWQSNSSDPMTMED
jgi:hypothetical protein